MKYETEKDETIVCSKKDQFFVSVTSVELISFFSAKTEADLHNINYIAISPIAEQQPRENLSHFLH